MISTVLFLQSECINDVSNKGAKKGHSICFTSICCILILKYSNYLILILCHIKSSFVTLS